MYKKEKYQCKDGLIRYPRFSVQTHIKKNSSISRNLEKIDDLETFLPNMGVALSGRSPIFGRLDNKNLDFHISQFEKTWCVCTKYYLGKDIPFLGKKRLNEKKLICAIKVLRNVINKKIDLELFLRAQFEHRHENPRVLWPSHLSSKRALKIYNNWITKFSSIRDAKEKYQDPTKNLRDVLSADHKTYLAYKSQGLSDFGVARLHYQQLSPPYLIGFPAFMEILANQPETLKESVRTKCNKCLASLREDSRFAMDFWKLSEAIRCQTE